MTTHEQFLDVAARIGHRLCRDALWADRRCNWLGWSFEPGKRAWTPVYQAHGTSLYDGTAGIALFLGWLAHFTGDRVTRRAASGALEQILAQELESGRVRPGYHAGTAGTAAAMLELAELHGNDAWRTSALQLLDAVARAEPDREWLDVMSGSAGVIPILLHSGERFERPAWIESARKHGRLLLDEAQRSERGWSWRGTGSDGNGLIGYAHGASGIACALAELEQRFTDEGFREAALEALRYERSFYDAGQRNWPDLRAVNVSVQTTGQQPAPHPVAWCHGAPGVAFARLRMRALLGENAELESDLDNSIATTLLALQSVTIPGPIGMSLCHGITGYAELLLEAASALGRDDLRDLAIAVGVNSMNVFHANDMPWPCGLLPGTEAPSLFLGVAGVGHFFLRLYRPSAVPSVLLFSSRSAS